MELKPDLGARRKLKAAARRASQALPAHLPPVFYLTDPARTPDPVAIAGHLPRGWGIIYRHFGEPGRAEIAHDLRAVTHKRGLTLLIANDPQLAMAVCADGVHWPERAAHQAKYWRGRFHLMTASAHTHRPVLNMPGIDAVLLSTVFPSHSPSASEAMGAARFRQLARKSHSPLYALGGVTGQTAGAIAGVSGVCGIDGIEAAFRSART